MLGSERLASATQKEGSTNKHFADSFIFTAVVTAEKKKIKLGFVMKKAGAFYLFLFTVRDFICTVVLYFSLQINRFETVFL